MESFIVGSGSLRKIAMSPSMTSFVALRSLICLWLTSRWRSVMTVRWTLVEAIVWATKPRW